MEPNCFGIIKGEQPLIRASRASKVAGAFLVLFWHAKENIPGGDAFCKRHETLNTRLRSAQEITKSTLSQHPGNKDLQTNANEDHAAQNGRLAGKLRAELFADAQACHADEEGDHRNDE